MVLAARLASQLVGAGWVRGLDLELPVRFLVFPGVTPGGWPGRPLC